MKAKVLVCDDDESLRGAHEKMIRLLPGVEVVTADDGTRALELIMQCPDGEGFDCVVTDNEMSTMHGPELLTAIRSQGLTMPVILLTGANQAKLEELKRLKFFRVLSKPARMADIHDAIRRALGKVLILNSSEQGRYELPLTLEEEGLIVFIATNEARLMLMSKQERPRIVVVVDHQFCDIHNLAEGLFNSTQAALCLVLTTDASRIAQLENIGFNKAFTNANELVQYVLDAITAEAP